MRKKTEICQSILGNCTRHVVMLKCVIIEAIKGQENVGADYLS